MGFELGKDIAFPNLTSQGLLDFINFFPMIHRLDDFSHRFRNIWDVRLLGNWSVEVRFRNFAGNLAFKSLHLGVLLYKQLEQSLESGFDYALDVEPVRWRIQRVFYGLHKTEHLRILNFELLIVNWLVRLSFSVCIFLRKKYRLFNALGVVRNVRRKISGVSWTLVLLIWVFISSLGTWRLYWFHLRISNLKINKN